MMFFRVPISIHRCSGAGIGRRRWIDDLDGRFEVFMSLNTRLNTFDSLMYSANY